MSFTKTELAVPRTGDVTDRLLFGAAYYPEYTSLASSDVARDLDLMQEAGFTVIRVGESVWSTWEPADGEFHLDWLEPVLDEAARRGIDVILGTPTYAVPPWLQKKHPEIASHEASGHPYPWGGRQEVDLSSETFREYARRVIERVVGRYAAHPSVIGIQVDNEPGMRISYNPGVFESFVERLKKKFVTVDRLNEEWGLVYWSHRIGRWSELWLPDGNTLPQYDLEWRRHQADITTDYIRWQVELVRPLVRADQFITTCISYKRPSLHDGLLSRPLDVVAANTYHGEQDGLDLSIEIAPLPHRETSGVWGLMRQADRAFSSSQSRFLVTEVGAQSTGPSFANYPPHPGQLEQAALGLVARGAGMIEYWHFNSLRWGTETYWGGILPHSGKPGRIYREVAEVGARLAQLRPHLVGFTPHHDVTFVYSPESKWAMEFMPPLAAPDLTGDPTSYHRIFDAVYRGFFESGSQARVLHVEQLDDLTAADLVREHPILVLAGTYVTSRALLQKLREYATLGGHLVLTPRTGYADEMARVYAETAPAYLADDAGVSYEEFSNLREPVDVVGTAFDLDPGSAATAWLDGLVPSDAAVLARYDASEHSRFAAATSAATAAGRVTVLGSVPNVAFARSLARWVQPAPVARIWQDADDAALTFTSGTNAAGQTIWFVSNWTRDSVVVQVPIDLVAADSGRRFVAGDPLPLDGRETAVLIESIIAL